MKVNRQIGKGFALFGPRNRSSKTIPQEVDLAFIPQSILPKDLEQ